MRSNGSVGQRVRAALAAPARRRSLRASLFVGNFLAALDYGDSLPRGEFSAALWWKVPLGYLVPFLVATCGNRIAASGEGLP